MEKFRQYYHTLRYLRPEQLMGQIWNRIRRTAKKDYDVPRSLEANGLPEIIMINPPRAAATDPDAIRSGEFDFLHDARDLGWPPDWLAVESDLWGFHLHYFGYVHALTRAEQEELCLDWIEANPTGSKPAWHPFPISLRLVNWCKAGLTHPDILSSIYRQAAFLHDHLETHLLGNHLLENARALITAGVYLRDQGAAESWVRTGRDLYEEQTTEQILADGGHIERSPMYHALMLEGYLDVITLLETSGHSVQTLRHAAERMRGWLDSMIDPEGQIVLFNDAAHNGTPSIPKLRKYADRVLGTTTPAINDPPSHRPELNELQVHHMEKSGYVSISDSDLFFAFDGGSIGPDYLPAHAHADIFSYVLHAQGRSWIVDSGTSTYDSGRQRMYERSTRAHNTVTIDDVDQAECWASFRVARRFEPACSMRQLDASIVQIDGTFEGYSVLIGDNLVHTRRVTLDQDQRRIEFIDRVSGEGCHRVASRIHLHPDVNVERTSEGFCLSEGGAGRRKEVLISIVDSLATLEKGTFSSEFGKIFQTKTIVLGQTQKVPVVCRYTIHY